MLAHPTLDLLNTLGFHGLAKGFKELEHKPEARGLDHAEWLGLLLEYETTLRRQKQFEARARAAKLRHSASVEDVDYQNPRGLDRALFLKLAACDWIAERRNLLVTGADHCRDKGLELVVLPPKRPDLNGCVERAQSSWRYEFYASYELPARIDKLQPLVDAFAHQYNHHRPHQALGDLTPAEYLTRISPATPPSHMC